MVNNVGCNNENVALDHAGRCNCSYRMENGGIPVREHGMGSSEAVPVKSAANEERVGVVIVFLAALCWSLGGMFARYIEAPDIWAVVFWRSVWAALFLAGFMLWRDGARGSVRMVRAMGLAGCVVGFCFAIASTALVVALSHTTVANVLLIQATGPLFAAVMAYFALGERITLPTMLAIAAVLVGMGIVVSDSISQNLSIIGEGLSVLMVLAFACATVVTRRFSQVRMTPAMLLGTLMAALMASTQAGDFAVSMKDMAFLFAFGAINLGLGMAFFAMGARMVPAVYAALLSTFEPLLGPFWVWLAHGEVPSGSTLLGGGIVMVALLLYIAVEFRRMSKPMRPGMTGISAPS